MHSQISVYLHTLVCTQIHTHMCTCMHTCSYMEAEGWTLGVHKHTHACNFIIKQSSGSQSLRKHRVPLTLTASVPHSSQALGAWV